MQSDGTPETDFERFALRAGLGSLYLAEQTDGGEITKAQADRLEQSRPEPMTNPLHQRVWDHYRDATHRQDTGRPDLGEFSSHEMF